MAEAFRTSVGMEASRIQGNEKRMSGRRKIIMKKLAAITSILTLATLLSAVPILAAGSCPVSFGEYDKLIQSNMKDQCLIVARNCASKADTVQQRVNTLRIETAKGNYVYSNGELKALREQLRWIQADSGNRII